MFPVVYNTRKKRHTNRQWRLYRGASLAFTSITMIVSTRNLSTKFGADAFISGRRVRMRYEKEIPLFQVAPSCNTVVDKPVTCGYRGYHSTFAYHVSALKNRMKSCTSPSVMILASSLESDHEETNGNTFATFSAENTETISSRQRKSRDDSASAKSRPSFKAPKNTPDDSMPLSNDEFGWSKLGLLGEFVQSVSSPFSGDGVTINRGGMGLSNPTPVQKLVIPAILSRDKNDRMQNIAFAAATGSGKTLAYLLPILQTLKVRETMPAVISEPTETRRPKKRPRALVLAPTRELAHQILTVIKSLSHTVKLSSTLVVGGEDYGKQKKKLDRGIDVLVATPGRLVKLRNEGHVFLGSVQHIVIDEMDTMVEQGFQSDIASLINPLLYPKNELSSKVTLPQDDLGETEELRKNAPQLVLTSATMTNAVKRLLNHPDVMSGKIRRKSPKKNDGEEDASKAIRFPNNVRLIEAPGLHRAVPRLKQVFIDVGQVDKVSLLLDVVSDQGGSGASVRRNAQKGQGKPLTLVFCNTVGSCRAAEHALAEAGVASLSYHGELNSIVRADNLKRFRQAGSSDVFRDVLDGEKPRILVCTDIAARGLDVPEVDHVVMFDFPLNPIDYLHRAGRTARGVKQATKAATDSFRAGNGRVTALVAKRDRVLAKAIESAVLQGEPLDSLSSRKSDYLPGGKLGAVKSGSEKRAKPPVKKARNSDVKRLNKTSSSQWGRRGRSRVMAARPSGRQR